MQIRSSIYIVNSSVTTVISRLDLRFRNDVFFAIILSTGLIAFVYDYVMLTIITKRSILDVAAALDPSLLLTLFRPSSLSGI